MKYELNHDAIAKQIFEKATVDMKARRKVEQLVKTHYELYLKRQALMSQEQLEEIRPFRQALNLSKEEKDFVEKSENALAAAQRRKFFITLSIIVTLAIMGAFAAWQWYKSVQQQRLAESGRLALLAQQQLGFYNFNDAFNLAQEALILNPQNNGAQDLLSQIFHRSFDNHLTPLCTATVQEKSPVINTSLNTEGSLLAVLTADSTIKIYDISKEMQLKRTISDCDTTFLTVFSPDNTKVLTLKNDSLLQLSRFDSSETVVLRGHIGFIRGAIFINNDSIISWANDGFIKLWNIKGDFLRDIGKHTEFVKSVDISSDGEHILSTDDKDAIIWRLDETEPPLHITHLQNLQAATFWNKDSIVLFGSEGIETWSLKQKKPAVAPLPLIKLKLSDEVQSIANPIFSKNGDDLLYISNEKSLTCINSIHNYFDFFGKSSRKKTEVIKMWQQMTGMSDIKPDDFLRSMVAHPNVDVAKAGFFNGSNMWTISEGSNEVHLRSTGGQTLAILAHPTPVDGFNITEQNRVAVTYSYNGYIKIWKHNVSNPLQLYAGGSVKDPSTSVYFSPNNQQQIVITSNTSPMRWYTTEGVLQNTFYDYNANGIAFSPDGQWILAHNIKGDTRIFDSLGQLVKKLPVFENPKKAYFSPDGSHFLIYYNQEMRIWNKQDSLPMASVNTKDEILKAIFTPDSKHILTCSRDSLLSEWTLEGAFVRHIAEHERNLSIAFSPDGQTILTSNSDGFSTLRDYKTGKILLKEGDGKGYMQDAQFLPDGRKILTTSGTNFSTILSLDGKKRQQKLFGGKMAQAQFLDKGKTILILSPELIDLWTVENQHITTFQRSTERSEKPTFSTAVSNDGQRVLIAFDNGTVKQYLTPNGIADWLKQHPNMRFNQIDKERYSIQ